jgi:PAS domain S-box-containing protein
MDVRFVDLAINPRRPFTRRNVLQVVAIMAGIGLGAAGLSLWVLYQASFAETRSRLVDTARGQARIIEAIARHSDAMARAGGTGDARAEALAIIADAHGRYTGAGSTGELVLARREGDWISFLLRRRHDNLEKPESIPWAGDAAEPMRRALKGESGAAILPDYRGVTVLVAYEPVPSLDAGIVVKADLSEIRGPFVTAGLISLAGTLAILLAGISMFHRISAPMRDSERAAALLAESEARMLTYFNSCPWGMTIVDSDSRYVFVNEAFSRNIGMPVDQIIGKTVFAHRSRKIAEIARAHERRVFESGKTISEIRRYDPSIENWREHISTKFPIFDEDGNVTGVGTYVTDISDLRQAEIALQMSEARFEAFFDNLPCGFCLKDAQGRYELVNETFAQWFGLPRDEIIGKTVSEVATVPSRTIELMAMDEAALKQGKVTSTEVTRALPGKKPVWMIVVKFPVRGHDGRITGVGTFGVDITSQKQAEEALRRSESRLREFVDSASDWLWETDEKHRFIYFSDRFYVSTGIPVDWVLGKTRFDARTGQDVDKAFWEQHRKDLDAHRPFRDLVYHSIRSDGTTVWYSVSGTPIFDEKGAFKGYRGSGSNITKRVQAETGLRESQALIQALLDHIPSMIGLRAPDGKYLLVNKCFERWTTLSRDDMNSNASRAIWPGSYSGAFESRYQSLVSQNRPNIFETQLTFPDGIRRDIRAVRFPVHAEDGTLLGLGFVNMDISDIRRSQAKLQEKEAQLRAIVDNAPGLIALNDMENRFLLVNRAHAEAYGRDAEDTVGQRIEDILDPDQWRAGLIHQQEVIQRRAAVTRERTDFFPSGKPNNRLATKFPVMDSAGEIIAIGSISIDDTDRREAEEALKKSERLLRSIFDNSPSAITMKDLDGRYLLVSRHIYDWYGVDLDSIGTRTASELFPKSISDRIAEQDPEVIARNRTLVEEANHVFADGKTHRVVVTKFPVPGPDGAPVGLCSIITDVTEQRKSEEQLRQAQKMEVVGQLTGGVAHDFNNLLGVIIGNLDYLRGAVSGNSRSTKLVDNAMRAARNGAELNRRLLAFSRKQPLMPLRLDLNDQVAGMIEMLQRSLGESIDIRTRYGDDLWFCHADQAQLESALLNLAVNARDAMPDGGVLTIGTENLSITDAMEPPASNLVPGDYVKLSVSDTGIGMTPAVRKRALEPFFTTKDVGQGSGLGLSMVFGFVR